MVLCSPKCKVGETPLTFAERKAIGARHTTVATQTRHAGPAATLAALGVTDAMLGTLWRAVAGWEREQKGAVGMWWATAHAGCCGEPHGYSRVQSGKPW